MYRALSLAPVPLLALVALCASCTTIAEIHGPTLGVGVEFDQNFEVSPRIELSYDYDRYQPTLGWGAEGGIAYSPLLEKVEFFGGVRGAPVIMMTSIGPNFAASWAPTLGWALGVSVNIGIYLLWPQKACIKGAFSGEPSPACAYTNLDVDDTVYPPILPRLQARIGFMWLLDEPASDGRIWGGDESEDPPEDPFYVSILARVTTAAGILTGRDPDSYDDIQWFQLRD